MEAEDTELAAAAMEAVEAAMEVVDMEVAAAMEVEAPAEVTELVDTVAVEAAVAMEAVDTVEVEAVVAAAAAVVDTLKKVAVMPITETIMSVTEKREIRATRAPIIMIDHGEKGITHLFLLQQYFIP